MLDPEEEYAEILNAEKSEPAPNGKTDAKIEPTKPVLKDVDAEDTAEEVDADGEITKNKKRKGRKKRS